MKSDVQFVVVVSFAVDGGNHFVLSMRFLRNLSGAEFVEIRHNYRILQCADNFKYVFNILNR